MNLVSTYTVEYLNLVQRISVLPRIEKDKK